MLQCEPLELQRFEALRGKFREVVSELLQRLMATSCCERIWGAHCLAHLLTLTSLTPLLYRRSWNVNFVDSAKH